MREDNPIDFWRGLALVMIFINHVPGNFFSYFTIRNVAVSDAAELFVFLAGWSLSYATGDANGGEPVARTLMRLFSRALVIYRTQVVITNIALATLAATAVLRANPLFLEWYNAGPAFYDPTRAFIGLALLTYQLGYFNILPMYVVLLLMAPLFVLLGRRNRYAALTLSIGLYAFTVTTGVAMPSWPSEEQWYFNPLSWQLLMVLGFLFAEVAREGQLLRDVARKLWPFALVVVMAGAVVSLVGYHPDPLAVPHPRLVFLFDKTYLSPARVVNFLAIVIVFGSTYGFIARWLQTITMLLCSMGRNSLAVFAVGSLLALLGQIIRFICGESLVIDTIIIIPGIILLGCTAWFAEWRSRGRDSQRRQL